jgi:hypothetical protein
MSVGGRAPQSITSKASARRGEASWSERAASSLPVPDSPPRSTGTVVGAARSSVAYTSRIGRDAPTRRPKAPRTLSGTSTAPVPRHHPDAGAPELEVHLAAQVSLTHLQRARARAVAAAEVAHRDAVVGGLDLDVVPAHVGVAEAQRGVVGGADGEPRAVGVSRSAPWSGPAATRTVKRRTWNVAGTGRD